MPAFWDTPRRPMITHTSDSHQIPSQKKTKSKLQILKNCQKFKFWNFASNFIRDKPSEVAWWCVNMKWIQPELYALQSGHGMRDRRTDGQMDGQTDGQMEWNLQLRCAGDIIIIGTSNGFLLNRWQVLGSFSISCSEEAQTMLSQSQARLLK